MLFKQTSVPQLGLVAILSTISLLILVGAKAEAQALKPRVVMVEFLSQTHIEAASGIQLGQTIIYGIGGAACIIENRARRNFDLEAGHKTMMAASDTESEASWSQNSAGPISISCGGGEIINTNGLEASGAKPEWFPLNLSAIARSMNGKLLIRRAVKSDYPRIELPDYIDGAGARERAAAAYANRPWYRRLLRY